MLSYDGDPAVELPERNDRYSATGMFTTFPIKTKSGMLRQNFLIANAENHQTHVQAAMLSGKEIMIFTEKGFEPYTEYLAVLQFSGSRERRNPGEYSKLPLVAYLLDIRTEGRAKKPLLADVQS